MLFRYLTVSAMKERSAGMRSMIARSRGVMGQISFSLDDSLGLVVGLIEFLRCLSQILVLSFSRSIGERTCVSYSVMKALSWLRLDGSMISSPGCI